MNRAAALWGVYFPFARNAFLQMLAYRLRYYTGIITYFIFISVHYFIWQAVFASRPPGERIHGFTLQEMVTYVAVGWISRSLYYSDIDDTIDELVRSGEIGIYLLRPVNFQVMMLVQAFGQTIFRAAVFSLPLGLVIIALFPVSPPAGWLNLGLFAVATLIAFFVLAQINFLVGLLAFYFKSIDGIVRAKYYLLQLCSGLLLPLPFFPEWAQRILDVLPFKAIASLPLSVYLGKVEGSAYISVFAQQLVWLVALFLLGRVLWWRALTKLTVQGG